ncbi:putative zinc finger protein 724 [Platysternon megacephalum]|uniref:Putative zinc finger protein 724 n=1 Tax=Platysternon megacephalum TaxID=55544 RepID=A0A4D9DUC3_9SAUR|nr:putative zinc finger protein 724 [Platysternon megacephalum]
MQPPAKGHWALFPPTQPARSLLPTAQEPSPGGNPGFRVNSLSPMTRCAPRPPPQPRPQAGSTYGGPGTGRLLGVGAAPGTTTTHNFKATVLFGIESRGLGPARAPQPLQGVASLQFLGGGGSWRGEWGSCGSHSQAGRGESAQPCLLPASTWPGGPLPLEQPQPALQQGSPPPCAPRGRLGLQEGKLMLQNMYSPARPSLRPSQEMGRRVPGRPQLWDSGALCAPGQYRPPSS